MMKFLYLLYIYIDLQRTINVCFWTIFKHQIINLEINKFDSCTTIINSINYDLIIVINFYSLIYLLTFWTLKHSTYIFQYWFLITSYTQI